MQENTPENHSINIRFLQFLETKGLTRYAFSKETGISESTLLNISKGKTKISIDVIEKLLKHYKVDANWLITGENNSTDGPIDVKPKYTNKEVANNELNEPNQFIKSGVLENLKLANNIFSQYNEMALKYNTLAETHNETVKQLSTYQEKYNALIEKDQSSNVE